jgi:excisionase family DNA binding protein
VASSPSCARAHCAPEPHRSRDIGAPGGRPAQANHHRPGAHPWQGRVGSDDAEAVGVMTGQDARTDGFDQHVWRRASESDHVLTVKEAAALARVSPATIRRWCRRGYVSAFQVGRSATIRIPREKLRKLVGRRAE